jgi:hypothetical protein
VGGGVGENSCGDKARKKTAFSDSGCHAQIKKMEKRILGYTEVSEVYRQTPILNKFIKKYNRAQCFHFLIIYAYR